MRQTFHAAPFSPSLLLLLFLCAFGSTKFVFRNPIHEIILESMPDVIYKMRGELHSAETNKAKSYDYELLLEEITSEIWQINLGTDNKENESGNNSEENKKGKEPVDGQNELKWEQIYEHVKGVQIFAEQVKKLYLFLKMHREAENILATARRHHNFSEEMLRQNIKNSMLSEASLQFGIIRDHIGNPIESAEEWTEILEIVDILLAQHFHQIVEAAKKGKNAVDLLKSDKEISKIGRKLRIAQVAPIQSPYPPRKYGGLERVVSYMTEALVQRGHEVTLISASDSVTCAKLVFKWHSLLATKQLDKCSESSRWLVENALKRTRKGEFDIVQIHTECDWDLVDQMVREKRAHVVVTLHYLMKSKALSPLGTKYTNIPLIAISNDQRHHRPDGMANSEKWKPNFVSTIHHGLPAHMYKFVSSAEQAEYLRRKQEQPYLIHIGRFSEKKRTTMAIEIAAKAGIRLKLAGFAFDEEYWQLRLRPLIVKTNFDHKHRQNMQTLLRMNHPKNVKDAEMQNLELEYRAKIGLLNDAFGKHEKQVLAYIEKLKAERARKRLDLWQYLAELEQKEHKKMLEQFQEELDEKLHKIVGKEMPNLTGDQNDLIEYAGEIGDEQKKDLLGNALAMLFPIFWSEPFGIVMIESMAFGTPIVTRKIGSVGEVIRPGISGLLFDTLDEGVEAVKEVGRIDRSLVRREFDARFTVEKMMDKYENVFEALINGEFDEDKGKGNEEEPAMAG